MLRDQIRGRSHLRESLFLLKRPATRHPDTLCLLREYIQGAVFVAVFKQREDVFNFSGVDFAEKGCLFRHAYLSPFVFACFNSFSIILAE